MDKNADFRLTSSLDFYTVRVAKEKNHRPDTDVPKITLDRKFRAVECDNIALQIDAKACLPQSVDPSQKSTNISSDQRVNS